jgi:hypothetical protein
VMRISAYGNHPAAPSLDPKALVEPASACAAADATFRSSTSSASASTWAAVRIPPFALASAINLVVA